MIEITDGFCFIMKLCSLPVIVCSQITKPSIEIYKGDGVLWHLERVQYKFRGRNISFFFISA